MVLFSEDASLKKYPSIQHILDCYCKIRYSFYSKRKSHKLSQLERQIKLLGNKKRFLEEVRDGDIKLFDIIKGKRQSRKTIEIIIEFFNSKYLFSSQTDAS